MKKHFLMLTTLMLILFPTVASANIIWPSIYIAEGMRSAYVIILGLVIEAIFVKLFEKQTLLRSFIISVIMNVASTVLGIILIPAIGFIGTILLGILSELIPALGNTFDTPVWIFSYILTIFTNVVVEGLAVRYSAKIQLKKTFLWLLAANTISVLVCILVHGFTLSALMH